MVLRELPPGPALRGTVRVFRIVHFVGDEALGSSVKVYPPTPEQSLQLFVHEPELVEYPDGRRVSFEAALVGAHDITVKRIVPPRFLMIQTVFEPGALYWLAGHAGTELQNGYVDAELVWGAAVRRLRDALRASSNYRGMVALVESFITGMRAARAAHPAQPLLRLLRDEPATPIEHLARRSSLSLRQFERLCVTHTGLAPRELASLARFDRAFHLKLQRPGLDWLSIAIACGYYDYQHMARDFRHFAGATPPRLLETQRSSPEHRLGVKHEFDLSYGAHDCPTWATK